ncbi:hypothetical protein PV10_01617 [Exophiala mesophila]|uniref:M protein repeat protein n=1 Tax=Exophiala mesophila TaxID=212818 RepID=A0A0D1YBB0_EXOME|nr:uncharacterized protein PV10_01617 [Exophiala mesophila]KIV97916.1 hypothetical protein PV10_01617 [Exophiala mesophila]
MGEKEDKEKAEKLAAAKKRVAQLQKKKKAGTGSTAAAEKSTKGSKTKKEDGSKNEEPETAEGDLDEADQSKEKEDTENKTEDAPVEGETVDPDEAAFNDVIKNAGAPGNTESTLESPSGTSPPSADQETSGSSSTNPTHRPARQPSISIQSKIRSTSFRDVGGALSPGLATQTEHLRVEELERENKRLAKEAEDHEKRWRRMEEELEELREQNVEKSLDATGDSAVGEADTGSSGEIARLKAEIETLKRRGSTIRRGSTQQNDGDLEALKSQVESKDSTIADMQLEISRLRGQLSSQTEGCETHGEQISALQTSLSTTEQKLKALENELQDTKKALSKASEKAVREGTERTSKDTKLRNLERELLDMTSERDEAKKKAEQLEKKIEAMNKVHREAEARNAAKLSTAEAAVRDVPALRAKLEKSQSENQRLREKHKRVMSGSGGDEGLDELEDEERQKLERKIRDLEGQVFELQRGVWRDKRTQLQPPGDESRTSLDPGAHEDFDEVDLSGSGDKSRRRSFAQQSYGYGQSQQQTRHSGFTQVLNSGLAAFRASTTSPDSQGRHGQTTRPRNDSLLEEFDGDDAFDEYAFAQAQREEEARKMVEHVREVKKGLKGWVGWRLDLVDSRRTGGGGMGFGEVFDI